MPGPFTLYFAPQTCARVTLTALEETEAEFETKLVAFIAGEHRKPEFLSVNPGGKVPALLTPDGPLVQNVAILSYLDEQFPQAGLLPPCDGPFERARALAELVRCSSDLHPAVTKFVLPNFQTEEASAAPGIKEKAREVLQAQLAPIQKRLESQPWMMAEGWSIIDNYLAWIWFRISGAGFEAAGFEAIAKHHDAAMARPSAQAALSHEERAQKQLAERGLQFRPPQAAISSQSQQD